MSLIAIALLLAATGSASNSLSENWSGQPRWTADEAFKPPPIRQHSESATAFFNGEWLMYHRSGDDIGLSTSRDGNTWEFERVVIPAGKTWFGAHKVYAPKLLILPGLLTMVYEAAPLRIGTSGCTETPKQVVAIAHSTDGRVWTDHRVAVRPLHRWEGRHKGRYCGNVGTPTITAGPDGFYIGYHGFNGEDGRPPRLARGVAVAPVGDPREITESRLRRVGRMRFTSADGRADALGRPEFQVGIGAADIVRWQEGSGGADDGRFYMVFEVFAGSPVCDSAAKTLVAIARSRSPAGPWAVQDRVLLGQKRGCWRDMPAWVYHIPTRRYQVVLTDQATESLQRLTLDSTY